MTESDREKLDQIWRGEKCIICGFSFAQIEFSEIEETGSGWVHKDCVKVEAELDKGDDSDQWRQDQEDQEASQAREQESQMENNQ